MNDNLENELKNAKDEVEKLNNEKHALERAIWDMLNYTTLFIVLLNKDMTIKLINFSLATKLGFKNEKEAIGSCWLQFVKEENKEVVKTIHHALYSSPESLKKYREVINDIMTLKGELITVKWFNIPINSKYNMALRFGMERKYITSQNEDSLRSYYSDIIEKDKCMINALRDKALYDFELNPTCTILE